MNTSEMLANFIEARVYPMFGDVNVGVSMQWSDGDGNKEKSFALLEPGKEVENRVALVNALVRGALKLGDGEELLDDVSFSDVLKLMTMKDTSGREYEELKAKVYDPYSCHERFESLEPPEDDE